MGLDTKIFANHTLEIPPNPEAVIALLFQSWQGRSRVADASEIDALNPAADYASSEILLNQKLIIFELERFNQITLHTNFTFIGHIRLCPRTICYTPFGIGRNATNMVAQFMNEPLDFYHDPESLRMIKESWAALKSFIHNASRAIGGTELLYLNDGVFTGVEEMAWDGSTLPEMVAAVEKIIASCQTTAQFLEKHTRLRLDGIRNVQGDIWFREAIL